MSTVIFRPNAAGNNTQLTPVNAEANYQCVDEDPVDDTDFVMNDGVHLFEQKDLYEIPNSSQSGTINKITVYTRCKCTDKTVGSVKPIIRIGGTQYDGTLSSLTNLWRSYDKEWSNNPDDSSAWEWTDIDNLEIGLALTAGSAEDDAQCSQVYVEVDYTPPSNIAEIDGVAYADVAERDGVAKADIAEVDGVTV